MAYGEARRKILFFRAEPDEGSDAAWDRQSIYAGIGALTGKDAYLEEDQVVRAEVWGGLNPQGVRLFKVRRDDLPGVDNGAGGRSDLELDDEAGLAEAIHIRLFPNRVIGAEFFFYGPRISRFERFVRVKLDLPFSIKQLGRHDVIEEALNYGEIRLLRIKLDPSLVSRDAAKAVDVDDLLNTASSFNAGVYVDVALRAEKNDARFTEKVRRLFRRLQAGDADTNIFEKLEIVGRPDEASRVIPLDLLSERLYRVVEIPYRTQRYRDLDADAAFSAIRQAYKEVEDDLPRDALG